MAISPVRRSAAESSRSRRKHKQRNRKDLRLQRLEDRNLMAVSPQLVAVIPNAGGLILPGEAPRSVAPSQLTFRFDEGQIIERNTILGASGIVITRSGGDGIFGNGNDVVITPGFKDIGDRPNEVVVRFADALPDDHYRIDLFGNGPNAITNTDPDLFNNGVNQQVFFELDLGANVVAVVPQPITRSGSTLTQARNQIVVYFNNDDLNVAAAQNTAFYQLIFTNKTGTNIDDQVYFPTNVAYNPATDSATLTFANDLALLGSGEGAFRLRIGSNYNTPVAPAVVPSVDLGSSFATSQNLGTLGSQTLVVQGLVAPEHFTLDLPGSPLEPGHRETAGGTHLLDGADTVDGITTVYYNFQEVLGLDADGFPLYSNVITPAQRQRAREAFELWGRHLGVQFVETADTGLTIATGDLEILLGTSDVGAPLFLVDRTGAIAPHGLPTVLVDVAEPWGDSEHGGDYFEAVMSGIGEYLGLGITWDLPGMTVMGSQDANGNAQGNYLSSTTGVERVFPGDADIIHGQYLFRPESKDIDVYSFTLSTGGTVKLETVAERLAQTSLLNTVITVYDAQRNIVARNDDYFSSDSFLELTLGSGTYYVAVSSTGNTDYDLNIPDSGFGGTTQGVYDLRITFNQEQTSGIIDATGVLLDGDNDGTPGGAYNFWFTVATQANTIYVDKASTASVGTLGTIGRPYTNIASAFAAATPGKVVRIVGNGGADNNVATVGDNLAYEVGFAQVGAGQAPLQDGTTMRVPRGVTVMIDAGAIFKLRRANIDVGSLSQGIDRSEGALQVLGTPTSNVIFTSYHNETVGVDTYSLPTTPEKGDWGGLVFRNKLDYEEGRTVLETEGIFLNYVNHADITYGGGNVLVASDQLSFSPIHLVEARPTVSHNRITFSAQAAISADPNSFEESRFYDTANTYELAYNRVGPDIDFNTILSNTINALFVRIDTLAGQALDSLTKQARFDDKIVHVLTESLQIAGTPGGPGSETFSPSSATDFGPARLDARLKIDAGTVVKLSSARIETQIGAQLIAEGSANNPIIFTSLLDDRYGASGTFDTSTVDLNSTPAAGDWSGLYFAPNSKGSFDHVLITFAGGSSPIEGTFVNFNALEIHGADVRLANSTLEVNADGFDATDLGRNGRGEHTAAVIFVRGAQPVIVNNTIRSNDAAVMSINVNSLNHVYQADYGRSTGRINLFEEQRINQGPLVRLNRLAENELNGMIVRGATLTTESVWDDTDIVHILRDEVLVPNFHTFGGLRLQSSPTESLVVKLDGPTAGFTAGGSPADIVDRIGGTVQVLGFPGQPVVLTSLADDTVGAGTDLNGFTVFDTNNDGNATAPAPGDWRSIRLDKYSNDRNMAVVRENENVVNNLDINGSTLLAQNLGQLARSEKESDDSLRVGFEVHGFLASTAPGDVDVYSFRARPRTEVWIDLDMTRMALDSIVELIDAEGNVVATSNNSLDESLNPSLLSGAARVLQRDTFSGPDYFTMNPRDAGMRVVLPGPVNGSATTYYVRVRANSATPLDPTAGETTGQYKLQVRLREVDEKPGSTVQFADIRYATRGIEVLGKPGHSPLIGEAAEYLETAAQNNNVATAAQYVGNLLTSDRYALGIAGGLTDGNDIDWYAMDVNSPIGSNALVSTIFDIDYADQLGRPDLRLSIYDETGRLILILNNSNIADDRPGPTAGNNLDDLSRGTVGGADPFIGPVNLPVGTYFVAVSHTGRQATGALQSTNPLVRLEPVNSTNRVIEDHVGFTGGSISSASGALFPGNTAAQLNAFAEQYHLGDVVFFVNTGSDLFSVNPFTGYVKYDVTGIGTFLPDAQNNTFISYRDIAMRSDGRLYSLTVGNANGNLNQLAISGNYRELSTYNGAVLSSVDDAIVTYQADPANPINPDGTLNLVSYNAGVQFEALAHEDTALRRVYAVGNITPPGNLVGATRNLLYILDANGVVIDDQTDPDPNDAESPTDAHYRGRLLTGPTLIPFNATDTVARNAGGTLVDPNFTNPGDLRDGARFTVTDTDGTSIVFEFDAGPDVVLGEYGAQAVRDGDTFILGDGVNTFTFEYDSGATITLPPGALAGSIVTDGTTITIFDNQTPSVGVTFEFDNDGTLNDPNRTSIAYANADTRAALVTSILDAINNHAFNVVATASVGGTNPYLGRISLENDIAASSSNLLMIEGDYGVTGTNVSIAFEETSTFLAFGTSTVASVQAALAPIRAGFDFRSGSVAPNADLGTTGDRITFYNGRNADFSGVPAFTHRNSTAPGAAPSATGIRVTSNIDVPFDAGDNSFDLAVAIANAINNAAAIFSNPDPALAFNVSATVIGDSVEISGANGSPTVDAGTPLFSGGNGPGGTITGLSFLNGNLYAVTDAGGLYIVNNPTAYQTTPGTGPQLQYIGTSADDLLGLEFTGLTTGPQNVENGRYADILFATANDGRIYALNEAGELQPVFLNGATSIDTGIPNLRGLAFSPIDYNLWHVTNARGTDPGHGINATYDGTRTVNVQGGTSFYFGLENPNAATTISIQPGAAAFAPRGTGVGPDGNPAVFQTYNVPGGAHGALTTDTFSLKNYSAADQPVLYFNYRYNGDGVRDVFRVQVSVDGGAIWSQLTSITANSNGWQQARIGLGALAGLENIKLRFEFLTSGDSNVGASTTDGSIFTTGSLMRALPGDELEDGDFFSLNNFSSTFEFDMGFSLRTPAGAGTVIAHGSSFTVVGPTGTATFSFDKGLGPVAGTAIPITNFASAEDVALAIAAAVNNAGIGVNALVATNRVQLVGATDVNTITAPLTLDGDAPGTTFADFAIVADISMTANDIAQLVAQALDQALTGGRTLTTPDSTSYADTMMFTLNDGNQTVTFEFEDTTVGNGVGFGNIAIDFTPGDSAFTIAQAIADAINLANTTLNLNITATNLGANIDLAGPVVFFDPVGTPLTINGNYDDPNNFTSSKVDGSLIRVIGHEIDFGVLPFFAPESDLVVFPGDPVPRLGFGLENFSTNAPGNDNAHEGIYIDDFIIGFAERGEMVTAANVDVGFTAPFAPPPPGGAYDLEIRKATDYTIGSPAGAIIVRQWDTNDRVTNGYALTAQAGTAISEGEVFVINDGVNVLTYEFDTDGVLADPLHRPVVFTNTMTDIDVAAAMTTAINAAKTAGLSRVTAASGVGGNIVSLFHAASIDALGLDITSVSIAEEKITGLDNDTLATAVQSGLSSINRGTVVLDGRIGDNPGVTDPGLDVDMIAVQLNAGDTLIVDVDSDPFHNYVDTIITLFDQNGFFVDQVDDDYAPGESQSTFDSYLEFTALTAGTYYIAISSFANFFFDPTVEGSGTAGSVGDYQVTVSVGATTGILHREFQSVGDSNSFRDQGYTILNGNRISHSEDYAIAVDAGTRDALGSQTFAGPVRTLREINTQRTVPGVSIQNNILFELGTGGILLSGDTNANADEPLASVLVARVTNNTIYGGANPTSVGIRVEENSFPTLLNNVFANLTTGIQVDAASGGAVEMGGSAFSNTTNPTQGTGGLLGQSPITIPVGAPLFVNPAAGNFYPAPLAAIIDSSINSLPERANMTTVTAPLQIAQSPILAPERDAYGLFRDNDPTVASPPGLGSNVFKDRGAIDRVDNVGPTATLINPVDNDAGGLDVNPADTILQYLGPPLTYFSIQLVDGVQPVDPSFGVGVDDTTISSASVTITKDGTPLVLGVDYIFSYNTTTDTIRLEPTTGFWLPGSYVVTLNNSATGIKDLAGNALKPNQTSGGATQFTIQLPSQRDYGDAPDSYGTLLGSNGARHNIITGYYLGNGVNEEFDGQPSAGANLDLFDDGVAFATQINPSTATSTRTATVNVTTSGIGRIDAFIDFNGDGDFLDAGEKIFNSVNVTTGVNVLTFTVPVGITEGLPTFARFRFSSAGGLGPMGDAPDGEVEDYAITIGYVHPWQNRPVPGSPSPIDANKRFDVNNDGRISILDLGVLTGHIRFNPLGFTSFGPYAYVLPVPPTTPSNPPPYLDINGDDRLTLADLAALASFLQFGGSPEGEAAPRSLAGGEGESAPTLDEPAVDEGQANPFAAWGQEAPASGNPAAAVDEGDDPFFGDLGGDPLAAAEGENSATDLIFMIENKQAYLAYRSALAAKPNSNPLAYQVTDMAMKKDGEDPLAGL